MGMRQTLEIKQVPVERILQALRVLPTVTALPFSWESSCLTYNRGSMCRAVVSWELYQGQSEA